MFQVELRQPISIECGPTRESLTLYKRIELPFVPARDISFGLEEDSDFGWEESRVEGIIWITAGKKFAVNLECHDCGFDTIKRLIDRGWLLFLAVQFNTAKEAISADREFYAVAIDGKYYNIGEHELNCLRLQGATFTIISEPEIEGN